MNSNPFIKLEEYYIFADLMEMPNLRKNSIQFIKDMIFQKGDINVLSLTTTLLFIVFGVLSSTMTIVFVDKLAFLM